MILFLKCLNLTRFATGVKLSSIDRERGFLWIEILLTSLLRKKTTPGSFLNSTFLYSNYLHFYSQNKQFSQIIKHSIRQKCDRVRGQRPVKSIPE